MKIRHNDICHLSPIVLISASWLFIIFGVTNNHGKNLGTILRQQRIAIPFTLHKISILSGVSQSHLGRIERGERFPSANILRKIAKPLGFEESELFTLAGYLSNEQPLATEGHEGYYNKGLDAYVANALVQEPVQVQRAVIGILGILKSLTKGIE